MRARLAGLALLDRSRRASPGRCSTARARARTRSAGARSRSWARSSSASSRARATSTIRGLVFISGKEKGFIVGADVREFEQLDDRARGDRQRHAASTPISTASSGCRCRWCAASTASASAAGSSWCSPATSASPRATTPPASASPRCKLGIFPGFNGTARSIRQAGALAAMPTDADRLDDPRHAPRAAWGSSTSWSPSPLNLRWAARKAIEQKRKSKPARLLARTCCGKWPARGLLAKKMRDETAKKVREEHYPAPFRLIDLFETHGGNLEALKAAETRAFAPLMVSDTSRNLRRVFKLSEMLKAQAPKDLAFKPLRVHVIGAGIMGADIAGWCVASGMEVTLQDVNAEQIAKGIAAQGKLFAPQVQDQGAARRRQGAPDRRSRRATASAAPTSSSRRSSRSSRSSRTCSSRIEGKLKPGAVLATNTSSIMIEEIAAPLADPGRLIGIHFFNPVAQMPLVEVVRGAPSREEEVQKGCAFVTAIDKFPLIVKSVPGLPRQPRAGALHDGGHAAAGERRGQGEDRRGGAHLRHADGADRARRHRRPRRLRPRRQDPEAGAGRRLASSTRWWRPASSARSRARASTSGRTASREKAEPEKPYDKAELERLGRELVEPLIARRARARRERRRERRSGRRRRDLRHRLRAVPRRAAALRGQRAEVERRGARRTAAE